MLYVHKEHTVLSGMMHKKVKVNPRVLLSQRKTAVGRGGGGEGEQGRQPCPLAILDSMIVAEMADTWDHVRYSVCSAASVEVARASSWNPGVKKCATRCL